MENQSDVTRLCDEFRSMNNDDDEQLDSSTNNDEELQTTQFNYEQIFEAHMNGINNTSSSTTIRDVFAARIWIRKFELLSFSSET